METCPKCGCDVWYEYDSIGSYAVKRQYECKTRVFNDGVIIQGDECKDRQIAALTESLDQKDEEIESLKDLHLTISDLMERLALWRKIPIRSDIPGEWPRWVSDETVAELKEMGEIE